MAKPEPNKAEPQDGITLIAAERARQIQSLGYDAAHDDDHDDDELAMAAAAYALNAGKSRRGLDFWPWSTKDWKPQGPLQDLVRAGALIAAAIDKRNRQDKRAGRTIA